MHEENWLDANGEKIFYRKSGSGQCVVFIHGFAEDGNIWDKQVNHLQEYFLLIVPDLPGSGKSALGHQSSAIGQHLSMDGYADIIRQILVKEEIATCTMIGHSMGGYITLAFAKKYPEKLNAFCLFHSTAYADDDAKKTVRKKSIEFILEHGAAEFIKQTSPNLFSDHTKKNNPEIIVELIRQYDNFNPHALVSYYEAMMQRPDRTNVLKNFPGPIQFIIGQDDNAVPLEQSLRLCYMPGLSYIHILESTGHMGMWEATDVVNNFLLTFINNATV